MMRRRTQLVLVVIMIAFVVLPVVTALADLRPSTFDDGELVIDESVRTYEISYRVTASGGRFQRDMTVQRPFASVIVDGPITAAADDSSTALTTNDTDVVERRASLGLRGERRANGEWVAFTAAPTVAPGDTRLAVARQIEGADAQMTQLASQEIVGRACTLYRVAVSPFEAAPLGPVDAAITYSEVCVDDAGIMLSWRDVVDRETVSVGVASSIRINVAVAEEDFRPPDETLLRPAGAGGGVFQPVDASAQALVDDEVVVEWSQAPNEWGVVDRRLTLRPGEATDVVAADLAPRIVDVWVDEADAVWLEQGPDRDAVDFDDVGGVDIETPAGTGRLVASLGGLDLWLPAADGSVVHVAATVSIERFRELLPLLRLAGA